MKIIHITPFYPPHMGGVEKTVKELAERAGKLGHNVSVYTSNLENDIECYKNPSLNINRFRSLEVLGTALMPMLPLKILSNVNENTIVHIHYVLNFSIDLAVLTSWIKNAKIVAHIHTDPLPTSNLGFLNPIYKNIFWKNILPLSDAIICPTEEYAKIFTQKYAIKKEKITVIPPGININQFKRKKWSNISFPINILYVGRLAKDKNIPRLLKSFNILIERYDAYLHIVGDGEERSTIERMIKNEKMENVILHGEIENEKINDLYIMSDIFVLPSNHESFGIVNLEAMASGIPIIASNVPGVRDILDGCAILVKPTPKNFADAMIKLIEDSELRNSLIMKSAEKVKSYDWDISSNKVLQLYETI